MRVNFFLHFYATYTLFPLSTSSFFAFAEITNIFHIFFLAPKSVSWRVYMNSMPHSFFPSLTSLDTRKPFVKGTRRKIFFLSLFLRAFQLTSSTVSCLLSLSCKRCRRRSKIYGPFFVLLVILLFQGISVVSVCVHACSPDKFQKSWWVWEEKKMRNKPRKGVSCMRMNLLVLFSHFFLLPKCFIMILLGHLRIVLL